MLMKATCNIHISSRYLSIKIFKATIQLSLYLSSLILLVKCIRPLQSHYTIVNNKNKHQFTQTKEQATNKNKNQQTNRVIFKQRNRERKKEQVQLHLQRREEEEEKEAKTKLLIPCLK